MSDEFPYSFICKLANAEKRKAELADIQQIMKMVIGIDRQGTDKK